MSEPPGSARPHWHVCVSYRVPQLDSHAREVLTEIHQIGLGHIEAVRSSRLYLFAGSLAERHVQLIASELLTDPVTQVCEYGPGLSKRRHGSPAVEVHTLPGVMNPPALSTLRAARRLLKGRGARDATIDALQTARRYEFIGAQSAADLERIAARVLANACIETWYLDGFSRSDPIPDRFPTAPRRPFELRRVPMAALHDRELARLSREAHLFLSVSELRAIRDHFASLGRAPTDLELETLAQTWSEHCVHKTLTSAVTYRGPDFARPGRVEVHFDNLLKDTIGAATAALHRDWCLSVFVDNAGVIAFDEEYGLACKVETHNHPSAIEPYGGAATGVGGCIRDIMGCGLGAKPIASTDVFCLAPPDWEEARVPGEVLHPRRVLQGVVAGVRDYGNRMGIPTVNGAIQFDPRYLGNPLVFCGCVGLIPRDRVAKQPRPGDHIVLAGGRTGRDGIHGATFSSSELTEAHASEFSHAVQIGHAIEEKKLLDALLLARDHPTGCLFSAVTDCGAGGLSSAVGEMGARLGAVVELDNVPLKYSGLRYDEIWISEAQERMVFAVPPDRLDAFLEVLTAEEVEASVIGRFTEDRVLRARYQDTTVGELDMAFLHEKRPRRTLTATWTRGPGGTDAASPHADERVSPDERLVRALSELNTASKEWVIRQYDHEVQGRSVIKPLVGPGFGPSDAAVLRPRYDRHRGVAVGCGVSGELGDVDPYVMAVAAVDEALRNVICVGANPERTAILDNFCWPKVDTEESLGALVRACVGARDAAIAFGLPFISGKDSLNNEFAMSDEEARRTRLPRRIAIPYTLLITALGIVDDVRCCVSMDLKEPDNRLVVASAPVVGDVAQRTHPNGDLQGSAHASNPSRDRQGADNPIHLDDAGAMHRRVSELIRSGKVRSAHDVSGGGLAVAMAEMCIAGNRGARLTLRGESYAPSLFAVATTTYVMEMRERDADGSGLPIVGTVCDEPRLRIETEGGESMNVAVADLARAWRLPFTPGRGG